MLTFAILAASVGRMPAKIHLRPEQLAERQAIGVRVRALRQGRGWTQPQLAERARLGDRQTIYRIELGTHATSLDAYLVVADALGVPLWRLFRDE
jgi:DNA-binding XRE family transcriptional regulator